jgi:UDP-N-acetylglucosamine/UDP-N-acetylgalactosamine diphosphorylase
MEREALTRHMEQIDRNMLQLQRDLITKNASEDYSGEIEPFTNYAHSGSAEDRTRGEQLIAEGKVGCLLIAGGQGTRLGYKGTKGTFPISDSGKTLFELCVDRVKAASEKAGRDLPLAVMTSPLNAKEIETFFAQHGNFGLSADQLFFYSQGMLPFLDEKGNLFLETKTKIAEGPDGNGSSLEHFVRSGIAEKWASRGIRYVNYVLIDNPLADPYDAELIGFHDKNSLEVTLKCIVKRDAGEKVGSLITRDGKIEVIEYSELPDDEKRALNSNGSLKHCCANISLFCFSMDFINSIGNGEIVLPLHKAFKATKQLDAQKDVMAWKFEKFIFDVLRYANPERVKALLYPREQCFAPLKNLHGNDSVETVREALRKAGIK